MGPSNSASFTGKCLAAHGTSWLSFGVSFLPSHVRTCLWRALIFHEAQAFTATEWTQIALSL